MKKLKFLSVKFAARGSVIGKESQACLQTCGRLVLDIMCFSLQSYFFIE
jgi:hypothetical protein